MRAIETSQSPQYIRKGSFFCSFVSAGVFFGFLVTYREFAWSKFVPELVEVFVAGVAVAEGV